MLIGRLEKYGRQTENERSSQIISFTTTINPFYLNVKHVCSP